MTPIPCTTKRGDVPGLGLRGREQCPEHQQLVPESRASTRDDSNNESYGLWSATTWAVNSAEMSQAGKAVEWGYFVVSPHRTSSEDYGLQGRKELS